MDKIAILDFGGQYAHLLANRVRRLNVYSDLIDSQTPAAKLKDFKGIIFSGGPQSVYDSESLKCDPKILELGVPILGICYGHQLLTYLQGGDVKPGETKEYGFAELTIKKNVGIFKDLDLTQTVWMSHGDAVTSLPKDYEILGSTKDCEFAAIANLKKNFYAVQFHVEVTHTPNGMKILDNFLKICEVERQWKMDDYLNEKIEEIKIQVGDKKVFMLISGGVDSTVAFALLEKALGPDKIYGLFVDTGFLRMNERAEVEKALEDLGFKNLHVRDASERYFNALKDKYDPEAKRKIVGDLFLKVQADTVAELGLNPEEWLLGQGTIYPDVIETGGTKHAAKIKTHHNRIEQIQELVNQGKVIEPLKDLYKDEVREVGKKLGLPEKIVWRHPFPGPGLVIRCLCSQGESLPKNSQLLENKINEFLHDYDLKAKILPIKSVGVQGDFRTYKNPVALIGKVDFVLLEKIVTDLINQFSEINRAVLLCSGVHIENIKLHKQDLNRERIDLLRKADDTVSKFLIAHNLEREIWQFPTVLLPISINSEIGQSLVLRPFCSEEVMTANFYKMDNALLKDLTSRLLVLDGVSAVFYDVTNKPPGTVEWE